MLQKIFYFCVLFSFLATGATNEINNTTIEGFTGNATAIELLSNDNDTITTAAVEGINATTEGFTDVPTELFTNGNDTITTTAPKAINVTSVEVFSDTATGLFINDTTITITVEGINATSIEGFSYAATGTLIGNDTIIITVEVTKAKCTKATKYTSTLHQLFSLFVWIGMLAIAVLIGRLLAHLLWIPIECLLDWLFFPNSKGSTKGSTQLLI